MHPSFLFGQPDVYHLQSSCRLPSIQRRIIADRAITVVFQQVSDVLEYPDVHEY